MTENEMIRAIYNEMQGMKKEMQEMKAELRGEMQEMKAELRGEMQTIKEDLQLVKGEVRSIREDLQETREELKETREELKETRNDLQGQITDIKLTLENVVNRNISVIAEGHLELSRKLDEAININKETEMMKIRLNIVENDVRILKAQTA